MFDLLSHFFHLLAKPFAYLLEGGERLYWFYLISSFTVALAVMVLLQRKSIKTSLAEIFDKKVYLHRSAINDYQYMYVNFFVHLMILLPITTTIAPFLSTHIEQWIVSMGYGDVLGQMTWPIMLLYTCLAILMMDFGIFFGHYLQHKIPILWEFHKVHHSAEVLVPPTVYRMHPVDDLLGFSLSFACGGIAAGVAEGLFQGSVGMVNVFGLNIVFFVFYILGYNLRHSQIWVDYGPFWSQILNSPAQHQIHHSMAERHWDKNFGLILSVWDKMFGTLYVPQGYEKIEYGLNDQGAKKTHNNLLEMYFLPFFELGDKIRNYMREPKLSPAMAIVLGLVLFGLYGLYKMPRHSVHLEDMTWTEVRDRIQQGHTVAIVPTGGTEQNGPHMILGKHNAIVRYTSEQIAKQLGNAMVAPVITYVPEGEFEPKTDQMRYPGTLTVPEQHYESLLEDAARSLKTHGFKTICFVGDSAWNQTGQQAVALRLSQKWAPEGVRVLHVANYYAPAVQAQWLLNRGFTLADIGRHAGIMDTSELMAVKPEGIRKKLLQPSTEKEFEWTGVIGDPTKASPDLGKGLLALKIHAAVNQIRHDLNTPTVNVAGVPGQGQAVR